jgi:hypothetical protein
LSTLWTTKSLFEKIRMLQALLSQACIAGTDYRRDQVKLVRNPIKVYRLFYYIEELFDVDE